MVWQGRVLVDSLATAAPINVRRAIGGGLPLVPIAGTGDATSEVYLLATTDARGADDAIASLAPGATFADLMLELGRYDAPTRATLVRAIAVDRWSTRYRYCPICAYALRWAGDGVAKVCVNPQSEHRHFPRLDPAIIVLVTDGMRALLGRAARYPPGFYSTLAGFVEPGEDVEAALRREVFEEAGVRVGTTRYFGSEAWPFPRSLMLGFFARAASTEITLHDGELEDARWFTRDDLRALQGQMKSARPYFDTIARRLIDAWLQEGTG